MVNSIRALFNVKIEDDAQSSYGIISV
jgi:hypothetical protein